MLHFAVTYHIDDLDYEPPINILLVVVATRSWDDPTQMPTARIPSEGLQCVAKPMLLPAVSSTEPTR